jgi:hypothetical protein
MYKSGLRMLNKREKRKEFVLTKKIAKHGNQAIIVIPKILQEELSPKTVVQLRIEVLKRDYENGK